MTNAELVREINRMIRGVALNYPDGLKEIRKQLDAVDATPAGREGSTEVKLPPAGEVGQWKPGPIIAEPDIVITPPVVAPLEMTREAMDRLGIEKRRPGRPKGSTNKPKTGA